MIRLALNKMSKTPWKDIPYFHNKMICFRLNMLPSSVGETLKPLAVIFLYDREGLRNLLCSVKGHLRKKTVWVPSIHPKLQCLTKLKVIRVSKERTAWWRKKNIQSWNGVKVGRDISRLHWNSYWSLTKKDKYKKKKKKRNTC